MADLLWWLSPGDEPRLSQGDIIAEAAFLKALHPPRYLAQSAVKGHGLLWAESSERKEDHEGYFHGLGRGRLATALVLTHSCQLDKPEKAGRVIIAPVREAAHLGENQKLVMAGHKVAFVPLPDVPGLGDCYADLRSMTSIDRKAADAHVRVAAMTKARQSGLHERLAGFFAREYGDPTYKRADAAK